MPTLISVDEFRERFDVSSDLEFKRISPHIGTASRRLRKWVGSVNYARASDVADNDDVDLEIVEDLKNAEAHLAFHFALLGFNSPLTSKGVVATAMSGEGKEMRKYLMPAETLELAQQFLEMARSMAEPYLEPTDSDPSSFEIMPECLSYT